MRKFQVTVNGNTYEVDVVEIANGAPIVTTPEIYSVQTPQMSSAPVTVAPSAPVSSAPVSTPVVQQEPTTSKATVAAKSTGGQVGTTKMLAPMQGKIVAVKVSEGQTISKGTVVAVLEAMKMENELVAPVDGVVASVNVTVGQTVKPSELVVSIN